VAPLYSVLSLEFYYLNNYVFLLKRKFHINQQFVCGRAVQIVESLLKGGWFIGSQGLMLVECGRYLSQGCACFHP